jgi:hypothetical protein
VLDPPDEVEQALVGEHLRRVLDQHLEQAEGLRAEADLAVRAAEPAGLPIENERAESELHELPLTVS